MLQLVIDVSSLERMATTQPDVLLLYVLMPLGALMVLSMFVWGAIMVLLDRRQGKFLSEQKWVVLAIDVPENEQSPKAVENIFAVVKGTKSVITAKEKWIYGKLLLATSFEIVSIDGYIQFFIRTNAKFRDHLEAAVYAQYPDAEITEVDDYAQGLPDTFPNDTHELFGGEIILKHPDYFPLRTYPDFEHVMSKDQRLKDPLTQLFELMSKLKPGEQFWFHILVHPEDADKKIKEGQEYILKTHGKPLPTAAPGVLAKAAGTVTWLPKAMVAQLGAGLLGSEEGEGERPSFFVPTATEKVRLEAVSEKLGKPGFNCKIRWAYMARHEIYNKGGRNTLWKGYIAQYTHPELNEFKYDADTMPRDDYTWLIWEYRRKQRELMAALKGRSWGRGSTPHYYCVEELATLWHFPTIDTKAPMIKKTEAKRAEAPAYLPKAGVGESDELNEEALIEVDEQGRPIGAAQPSRVPGADVSDILADEPLIEPGQEGAGTPSTATGDEEIEPPFVPPNLPV
ncbi:MAG: hypothetical protein AAB898_01745 [Patescibacteria group bacterium]